MSARHPRWDVLDGSLNWQCLPEIFAVCCSSFKQCRDFLTLPFQTSWKNHQTFFAWVFIKMPLYSTCWLRICAALRPLRLLAHWVCSAALAIQYCPSGQWSVCERECECSTSFCILLTSSYLSIHTFLTSMRMALTFLEFFPLSPIICLSHWPTYSHLNSHQQKQNSMFRLFT